MKKLVIFILCLLTAASAFAQTQKGYVKTKGRIDDQGNLIPGEPLKEVVVKVRNRTTVLSDRRGEFSFPMPDQTYYLESVTKNDYVLVDPDVLSKQYFYSKNKLVIALETKEQQLEERSDIFNKINTAQLILIDSLRTEVKRLRSENKLNDEEYSRRLNEIIEMQKENTSLIEEMVEKYSRIDYDQLSEFDRQFSTYLLSGDLHKADSLLKTKDNLADDYYNLKESNAREREELDMRRKRLERNMATEHNMCEELANLYYHKYEYYKVQHKNDSAAYYLEERVKLDTTNVNWLLDAGYFLCNYLESYDKAQKYYENILILDSINGSNEDELIAKTYTNWGRLYKLLGKFDDALICYEKSLNRINNSNVINYDVIITDLNRIGSIYLLKDDKQKALDCFIDALNIQDSVKNSCVLNSIGLTESSLGNFYSTIDDYKKAYEYYIKALDAAKNKEGEFVYDVAVSYGNIGWVLNKLDDYASAIENYQQSINILKLLYGDYHTALADQYSNIGTVYYNMGDKMMAMQYTMMALDIRENILPTPHPDLVISYNNIGQLFQENNDYDKAIQYYDKALQLNMQIFGENHLMTAKIYNNLCAVYSYKKDYDSAIDYINKALQIRISLDGENSRSVAACYNNIGYLYNHTNNNYKAIEYYKKALNIYETKYDENKSNIGYVCTNIGAVYSDMQEYNLSLEYLNKALAIREELYGLDDKRTQKVKSKISDVEAKLAESTSKSK